MAIKCRKCNKFIGRTDDYITCRKECNSCYHIACANLSKAAFKLLKDADLIKTWGCSLCSPLSIPSENRENSPYVIADDMPQKLPEHLKTVITDLSRVVAENFSLLRQQVLDLKNENLMLRDDIAKI